MLSGAGKKSLVLLKIDFDADNQDDILRTVPNGNWKL
tara:strand:+ start:164 stop:274 length:111 start_codon:yes stop_codon:yes gene_type:complete